MLKKISAILVLLLLIVATPQRLDDILGNADEYLYYVNYNVAIEGAKVVSLGIGSEVCLNASNKKLSNHLENIVATSLIYRNVSLNDVDTYLRKLQVKVKSQQTLDNIRCVYGYSPFVKGSVEVDGQKINIQLAFVNDILIIGSPLIVGSY